MGPGRPKHPMKAGIPNPEILQTADLVALPLLGRKDSAMKLAKLCTRRRLIVLAAVAAAVGLAGGAFAYFTSTGSGTGSATVGSSSNIQLSSPTVGPLYPGGPDVPVTVTIHNPGSGNEYVATISGTIADGGAGNNCSGSWFTVAPIVFDTDVAGGASPTASTTVTMADSGTNQDACQGATLTINWSSN